MESFENAKSLARSKHRHSLTKDKNRFKKKAQHIIAAKKKQEADQQQQQQQRPENESEDVEQDEEAEDAEQQSQGAEKPRRRRKNLPSNAYRYDEEEDSETLREQQEQAEERQYMKALLTQGGAPSSSSEVGFQFQEEKAWDEETLSNYASIDVDSIGRSLRTLPLSKRLNIESNLFPEETQSDAKANQEKESMQNFFRISSRVSHLRPEISSLQKPAPPSPSLPIAQKGLPSSPAKGPAVDQTKREDDALLDELLSIDQKQQKGSAPPKQQKSNEDDLESWLDEVISS